MKRKTIVGLAVLCLTLGCKEKDLYEDFVPLEKVPAPVMAAAKKALPDVNFQDAWKEKAEGEDAYEIRGMTPTGVHRDVKVSVSGKVLEVD